MTDTPAHLALGAAQSGPPHRIVFHTPARPPAAVTVDIVEPGRAQPDAGGDVLVPRYVVVNGRSLFTPEGTKVKIETEPKGSGVEITLSFLARQVRIGFADELGIDLDAAGKPDTTCARCDHAVGNHPPVSEHASPCNLCGCPDYMSRSWAQHLADEDGECVPGCPTCVGGMWREAFAVIVAEQVRDGHAPPYAVALARAFASGSGLDFAGEPVPREVQDILEACERVPDGGALHGPNDLLALLYAASDELGAVRVAQAASLLATGHDPGGRDVADAPGQDGPDAPLWRGWTHHGASIPGMVQLGERPPASRCMGTRSCSGCIADAERARGLVFGTLPPAESCAEPG